MSSMSGVQASGVPPSAGSGGGDCSGWKKSEAVAVSIAPSETLGKVESAVESVRGGI